MFGLVGRPALLLALVALAATAGTATAITAESRTTRVASPPPESGVVANGDSGNATFSQDERKARYMAFDSSASNLVDGDTNGVRDVFMMVRGTREGRLHGRVVRVSLGNRGKQANGESRNPSLSGDTRHRPRCVAFESRATNLSGRDRDDDWDVYVYDFRRKRVELASPGRRNATDGVVDGECEVVTFESGNRVYARDLAKNRTLRIARGDNPDQQTNGKGVAYERGRHVYYRQFQRRGGRLRRRGGEVLVDKSRTRRRANGTSRSPTMDDNGHYVAFESTATNLCSRACRGVGRDGNGRTSDVFRRTLSRRAPTRDYMQMVSYSHAVRSQGDGPSTDPEISGAGENVVFVSEATNLRESSGIRRVDPNGGTPDVYYWNFPRKRRIGNVSRESRTNGERAEGQGWPAPVRDPAISNKGNYIAWTSGASGPALRGDPDVGERNGAGIADVFIRFMGGK